MQEMQVWYLGQEDPLEKEMATHCSILAWRIPWTEETGRLQSMGLQRVGHDWATSKMSHSSGSLLVPWFMYPLPLNWITVQFSSVQFSRSVVSDYLRPYGLQHTRLPCLSPAPRACSNSCPLSRWCHPTISSSVVPFSSCLQSFPASRSFPMSQLSWIIVIPTNWFPHL